jgi:hypothetical protein
MIPKTAFQDECNAHLTVVDKSKLPRTTVTTSNASFYPKQEKLTEIFKRITQSQYR